MAGPRLRVERDEKLIGGGRKRLHAPPLCPLRMLGWLGSPCEHEGGRHPNIYMCVTLSLIRGRLTHGVRVLQREQCLL